MAEYVYQLEASGQQQLFSGKGVLTSTTVFPTYEAASKRIEAFRAASIDPGRLLALEEEGLVVRVVPLEIIQD